MKIEFGVRGQPPVPWASNEWDWRRRIAEAARQKKQELGCELPSSAGEFAVSLVFWMRPERVKHVDLDNLAKPVLDTLFRPYRPQVSDLALTGALFPVDDSLVYELNLAKRLAVTSGEEGIDITVIWEPKTE